jgi:hypothetical protein
MVYCSFNPSAPNGGIVAHCVSLGVLSLPALGGAFVDRCGDAIPVNGVVALLIVDIDDDGEEIPPIATDDDDVDDGC